MFENNISREIIKCVLVGDRGVGKTRLICAHVCSQKMTLDQLMTVHTPTVWAVDPYRIYSDSFPSKYIETLFYITSHLLKVVDGFQVSYRPWDTFGDHKNDRCFAYSNAHAVLVCFSAVNKKSLQNTKTVWYQEVKRYCPYAAILLVACKTDLRYIWQYPEFELLLSKKPRSIKIIQQEDIVCPSEGRAMAKEMGGIYVETSVLNGLGVDEVFKNAIRVAFTQRRKSKFRFGPFMPSVKYPSVQKPYLPEKPKLLTGTTDVPVSTLDKDLSELLNSNDAGHLSDVHIIYGNMKLYCHRLILSAGSKTFFEIFTGVPPFPADIKFDLKLVDNKWYLIFNDYQVHEEIVSAVIHFLYNGTIGENFDISGLNNLKQMAVVYQILSLVECVENIIDGRSYLNEIVKIKFLFKRNKQLFRYGFELGLFTDINIILDDNSSIVAHRFVLSARCDFMKALFSNKFQEMSTSEVRLPGISKEACMMLLSYIFTDNLCHSSNKACDYLNALEMSNRFCLPLFQNVVEREILKMLKNSNRVYLEDTILLLEFSQLHNAKSVSKWCLHYLSCNCKILTEPMLKKLSLSNQNYIHKRCWPPYFEECEFYDSVTLEKQKELECVRKKIMKKKSVLKEKLWLWL